MLQISNSKMKNPLSFIGVYFSELVDPRGKQGQHHIFTDILSISLLGIISGADDFTEIELWGKSNEIFLKKILYLPKGIPSHDTFSRVFQLIDNEVFEKSFIKWTKHLCKAIEGVISFDGKVLRGSHDLSLGNKAIWMVSAWSSINKVVLGQIKVAEKSNEITAIPKLLDLIDVKDSTVTIDAMGTQLDIAKKLVEKGADYVLAVKGNQKNLYEEIQETFKRTPIKKLKDEDENIDLKSGRLEFRRCYATDNLEWLSPNTRKKWEIKGKLKSLVRIESVRIQNVKGEEVSSTENRFYITTHPPKATILQSIVREHWGIENELHWCLDVCFHEDDSRTRKGNGAENLSILRRMALNLLKQDKTKMSMKNKRKKAGWDKKFLLKILKI